MRVRGFGNGFLLLYGLDFLQVGSLQKGHLLDIQHMRCVCVCVCVRACVCVCARVLFFHGQSFQSTQNCYRSKHTPPAPPAQGPGAGRPACHGRATGRWKEFGQGWGQVRKPTPRITHARVQSKYIHVNIYIHM